MLTVQKTKNNLMYIIHEFVLEFILFRKTSSGTLIPSAFKRGFDLFMVWSIKFIILCSPSNLSDNPENDELSERGFSHQASNMNGAILLKPNDLFIYIFVGINGKLYCYKYICIATIHFR